MIYKCADHQFERGDFMDVSGLYRLQRLRVNALETFRKRDDVDHETCYRAVTAMYELPSYHNFEKWASQITGKVNRTRCPWLQTIERMGHSLPDLFELEEDFNDIFGLEQSHLAFYKNDEGEMVVENFFRPTYYMDVYDLSDTMTYFPNNWSMEDLKELDNRDVISFDFYSPLAEGFVSFDAPEEFEWQENCLTYIGFESKMELIIKHFPECLLMAQHVTKWTKKYGLDAVG